MSRIDPDAVPDREDAGRVDREGGDTSVRRPFLLVGGLLLLLLGPLSFLGNLRAAFLPYAVLTTGATLLLYGSYLLWNRRDLRPSRGIVLGVALTLRLAMLPMGPSLSDDVYRYLWDGRLLLHGENPYLHIPADTSLSRFHDELYRLQGYPTTNTIYPPGAMLLFAAAVSGGELVTDDYRGSYYIWKLLLICGEMGALMLMMKLPASSGRSRRRLLLYAWHPLPVIELAGQGHTDGLWVLALAAALYLYAVGRGGRGLPALAFGSVTRLFPVLTMPLWGRFLNRRDLVVGVILSVPVLLLFAPFLDPRAFANYFEVLGRFTNYYEFNGGVYYGVKAMLDGMKIQPSNLLTGRFLAVVELVLVVGIWLRRPRDRSMSGLAWGALLLTSVQIIFPAKVHVWYFVAPLFLLTVAGNAPVRSWLWMALLAPVTYAAYTTPTVHESAVLLWLEWGGFALLAVADLRRRKKELPFPDGEGQSIDSIKMPGSDREAR